MHKFCTLGSLKHSQTHFHCSFHPLSQRRSMVKFTKEFEAQLVPEWKHAFVDYWQLKKDLKKIRLLHTNNNTNNVINNVSPHKKENTTFSTTLLSSLRKISPFGPKQRNHSPIHVHRRLASSAIKGDQYETELVQQFEGVEAAREFFALLDVQLNKVNHFYKTKENEFLERGDSVKKQMEILLELKAAPRRGAQSDDTSITCHIPSEDLTESAEEPDEEQSMNNETKRSRSILIEDSSTKGLSGQVFNCQGKNIKLNIPHTASSRTLSALSCLVSESLVTKSSKKYIPRGTNLHANKTKLHQAEKIIRGAFIELYKGLGYIKTYRNLNTLAFVKILKKFDKVTQKEVMPIYLRVVESSYFNSSDSVMKLADEIEELFVKHFTENDHKKAMKYLKPNQRKESHAITFFIGLFTGCFIALLAGYVIMARIAGMYTQASDTIYMETVYPVLSMFSLLFLHFFLYGCNIYLWKKARINYSFIFDLAPSKELKYKRVFLICSTSMTVIIGVLFIHLSLIVKGYNSTQAQAIPSILLLCFLLLVICPFNIVYKSSRYRFLRVIRNIALSPLYTVSMFDFFMADQLCSQVPLLRNLEYLACYYITGSYKTQDYGYCMTTTHYRDLAYAVSLLPYYWRAMQCARRWFDEGETSHLANLGKYVSAMLAAGAKVAYEKKNSVGYLCLVVAMSSAATVYQLYWDYVKDWGLLQCDSKNPWLRNELMVRRKFIYYFSMVLNFVLRLAWLQTVLHPNFGNVDYRVMGLFLAALEVIRRGQWNFYRLENEHLNNTGKFREVKTVPLPFREVDGQD